MYLRLTRPGRKLRRESLCKERKKKANLLDGLSLTVPECLVQKYSNLRRRLSRLSSLLLSEHGLLRPQCRLLLAKLRLLGAQPCLSVSGSRLEVAEARLQTSNLCLNITELILT